ncbi:MAG: cell division protein ZapA [Eubacteriaceae bacterium]|nr:cell division protein ZapA [Eubacteriaceae bacterium]
MPDSTSLSLNILGNVVNVKINKDEQENIKRIAEYVNDEMENINQKSPFGNRMHIAIIGCMNIAEKLFAAQAENEALKEEMRQFELDKEDLGSDIKKTEAQVMNVEQEKTELIKEKDALIQELNDKNDLLNQYREHLKQAKNENDANRKSILELQNKLFETQIELSKSQENIDHP